MGQEDIRFTPAEIKELAASGELKAEDLALLHPEDAKVAKSFLDRAQSVGFKDGLRHPNQKGDLAHNSLMGAGGGLAALAVMFGGSLAPLMGAIAGKAATTSPGNVEKMSREAFDKVGLPVVQRLSAMKSLMSGDRTEQTKVLFGGLNQVGDKYIPPAAREPINSPQLRQIIKNVQEVSKSGYSGVTRRRGSK